MNRLPSHRVRLIDGDLVLRPMTEEDVPRALEWDNDPEVRWFVEGESNPEYTLEELRDLYRAVSRAGYVFLMELDGGPVGECWLQDMNVPRLIERFRGRNLKRIDLTIGVKEVWGRGVGTRAIRLLTRFGLQRLHADALFGVGIHDFNTRSLRAFGRAGFRPYEVVPTDSPGKGGSVDHTLVIFGENDPAQRRRIR